MPPKSLTSMLPFQSFFFSLFDLKLGSEIITWFAILNKVAGFYGLLAVFTGGTLAQLSMYLYSVASIVIFSWGAKQIGEVSTTFLLSCPLSWSFLLVDSHLDHLMP
jgi:hypothetical protein